MKSIIKSIALSAVALLATSCLDLEPKDQQADNNMWQTPGDFENFANQFYGWTCDFNSQVYDGDKRSDLIVDKGGMNVVSNGTNTVPQSDGTYTGCYSNIRRCNLLLEKAAGYPQPNDIAQSVGEAYFFRAYKYFTLLQCFGDAIIVTNTIDVTDGSLRAKRNDRSEVADLILADLDNAIERLGSCSDVEAGRVGKEAAQAFKARVALYEGTWQKFRNNVTRGKELLGVAAKAAKEVIDSKKFSLFAPAALGDSAQKYMFILEDAKCNPAGLTKSANNEYIFSRRYDQTIKPIGKNITVEILANAQMVSRKMANMYLCSDGLPIEVSPLFRGYDRVDSEWQNRDHRMEYTLMRPHRRFWSNATTSCRLTWDDQDLTRCYLPDYVPGGGTGYYHQKWAAEREVPNNYESYDYPIIRYAEVLLIYAEAVFERDDAISDEDLNISLNLVRKRVNKQMPALSNGLVNANGLDMQTEIRRERTVELFCEGFRLDDLKRWKTAGYEMPMDFCGVKVKGTEFERREFPASRIKSEPDNKYMDGCIIWETGRKWSEKNYLYPLPIDQLQLNPNLEQNPGWAS